MEKKDMVPVGTKVSPEAKALFHLTCDDLGVSEYDALQMFIDVFIRMRSPKQDTSYELEQLINLFDPKAWKDGIRLTDPVKDMKIAEAIYFLTEPGRQGARGVHVQGAYNDMWRKESFNVQEIVERFVCLLLPNIYRVMRMIGAEMGTNSIYETLCRIVDEYKTDPNADELRIMFADNDWERGRKMSDQQGHKSTRNNHPELFQ